MLQAALLLLGCALSRYLWETSIAVALVVLGVTSFGVLFYLFILIAGATTESCPYQTPASSTLRYLWQEGPSALGNIFQASKVFQTSRVITLVIDTWRVRTYFPRSRLLGNLAFAIRRGLTLDILHLCRAANRVFPALAIQARQVAYRVYTQTCGMHPPVGLDFDLRTAKLDLRCISWTLQTSLESLVHLSTLEYLITITDPTILDPVLVTECFNIFVGCVSLRSEEMVIIEGSERLATLSAGCFFRSFHFLSAMDPTSSVLLDLRRRYNQVFPFIVHFRGLPFHSIWSITHSMLGRDQHPSGIDWRFHRLSDEEYIPLAWHMAEAAQAYQRSRQGKVPRWILRFALHALSLDSPPPPSVVVDCLKVIGIDLGCSVSNVIISNDRCVQIGWYICA